MSTPLHFSRCRAERKPVWTNWLELADGRAFGSRVERSSRGGFRVTIGQQVPGVALLNLRGEGEAESLDEAFWMAGKLVEALVAEDA